MSVATSQPSDQTFSDKEFIRGAINLRPRHHGSVATIGSFDGVHLGHQAIIRQLREKSQALHLPAVAVIFEPQPREFFHASVARILPLREKVIALFEAGIDRVLCLRFNSAFSAMPPEVFVEKILVAGLGVKFLVVGDDFRFGRNRDGDDQLLVQFARQHQFEVATAVSVEYQGQRVSSSTIRDYLAAGDFETAERLLGKPFTVSGRAVYGRQLGTQLGVPTANIPLRRAVSPVMGSFAVTATLEEDRIYQGVANVGIRPTIGGATETLLEAHLFDYRGELYGRRLVVTFHQKIRDEKKFDSLDALKHQIENDIAAAKHFFNQKSVSQQ